MSIQQIKSGVIADDAVTAEKVSEGAPYWDASGNVLIGRTSQVVGEKFSTTGYAIIGDSTGSGGQFICGWANGSVAAGSYDNVPLIFRVNNTERARIDTSSNFKFNSGYGSVATAYGCRAWVNFQGTGTVTIRESGNVSSITDNGTGTYTINFTTAMPDANYAVVGQGGGTSASTGSGNYSLGVPGVSSVYTTTQVKVQTWSTSNSLSDTFFIGVAIFR